MLQPSQIVNLAQLAGFHIGLCEWRPQKKGDYGRFTVEYLTVGKTKKAA
jgi:hypothetical protein